MKKIFALFLSISMIAGMMVLPASAADEMGGLSVDKTVVTASGNDKEFTLTSKIPAITGQPNNVTIRINFDKDVLEYVKTDFEGFKIGAGTPIGNEASAPEDANNNGFVTYVVAVGGKGTPYVDLSEGHTANFTFKVKDSAALGKTTISYDTSTVIKNKAENFVPTDWTSSVSVDVITNYIKTVQVSGISVDAGSALPTTATLAAEGLANTSAAITWNPSDTTAADQDYGFTLDAKALTDDTHEYRFADQVAVTGLEDFSEVTAVVSKDGKTLTIAGQYVSRKLGDVDGNETIDMDDALEILNKVLGATSLIDTDPAAAKVADVDANGVIDMDDALEILNKVLGAASILG